MPSVELQAEFDRHVEQWKTDTQFLSDADKIAAHPSYLHIISMGRAVLPLIMRDLEQHGSFWFIALEAITGHFITPVAAGDIEAMRQVWLTWGKLHGYLPRAKSGSRVYPAYVVLKSIWHGCDLVVDSVWFDLDQARERQQWLTDTAAQLREQCNAKDTEPLRVIIEQTDCFG